MASYDIVGYTYRADFYCPACCLAMLPEGIGYITYDGNVESIEAALDDLAAQRGIDRTDERSFDSDEFPKIVFRDQVTTKGDVCGNCWRLLNP